MYDALERTKEIRKIVCRNNERKYYRFRAARFYGGIATADCVGCNLNCFYCWSFYPRNNPEKFGKFYSPEEVAKKLIKIAEANNYKNVRISGNEPTICKDHLIKIIELIPEKFLFILETNGILIGSDEEYAKALSKFKNLHVRVSLKGATPEIFSKITGAMKENFYLQIKALENLEKNRVSYHAAIMIEFADNESQEKLKKELDKINPKIFENLEFESLMIFPHIKKGLRKL
ncbi:MAG: radical SAM protein [Candidatus Parvarchaeota archaeon]|nr:radical SAM protein [Candidatus Jingweiarchaeum tengchongense]MCW1298247.1 radical SAM protein [Candidatus Jingweiarchaeum tengchongense]MCW1300044.1 radical SAM protein [Candidatus Jingweiarchaeum tengchongense]MCW1304817.1 radical SAM protein [Candidatus Jingweiarchaeum tengchongense]MCW1305407.1 radical SAM protein [Candidatus Jingweiarchaeum tengchongense]